MVLGIEASPCACSAHLIPLRHTPNLCREFFWWLKQCPSQRLRRMGLESEVAGVLDHKVKARGGDELGWGSLPFCDLYQQEMYVCSKFYKAVGGLGQALSKVGLGVSSGRYWETSGSSRVGQGPGAKPVCPSSGSHLFPTSGWWTLVTELLALSLLSKISESISQMSSGKMLF